MRRPVVPIRFTPIRLSLLRERESNLAAHFVWNTGVPRPEEHLQHHRRDHLRNAAFSCTGEIFSISGADRARTKSYGEERRCELSSSQVATKLIIYSDETARGGPRGLKPPYFRTGFSSAVALRVVPSVKRYTAVFLRGTSEIPVASFLFTYFFRPALNHFERCVKLRHA